MKLRNGMAAASFAVAVLLVGQGARLMLAAPPVINPNITLMPFSTAFNTPIGIDFFEPVPISPGSGQLIASVNYPTGSSNNFDQINATGVHTPFSAIKDLDDEVKIATVRDGVCTGGFVPGTAFAGNGQPGGIVKINPDGTFVNPWVTLPGEVNHIRGSLYQDRACAFGGELIVVTGNEQNGNLANDFVGNVWRVSSATPPVATPMATISRHLEGVITLPNDVTKYGPLAGRIVAGDEDMTLDHIYNAGGRIWGIKAQNDIVTVGAPAPGFTNTNCTTPTQINCNFPTLIPLHPEDLDVIPRPRPGFGVHEGELFAVDFGGLQILKAPATDFTDKCGDVLVTQEFPTAAVPAGLSHLRWDGTASPPAFAVLALNNTGTPVGHFEHVTFWGGEDCTPGTPRSPGLTIAKTPDAVLGDSNGTFTQGGQTTFNFLVTNNAKPGDPTAGPAIDVQLDDILPGNGGLVWKTATTTQGTCVSPIVNNVLHCSLGDIQPGGTVLVTVKSDVSTPPEACQLQFNPNALATAFNSPGAIDGGSLICSPPSLGGRMTGGGSVFTTAGVRVTHGFQIRCDANDTRQNLEINWPDGTAKGSNNFHLTDMTAASCTDDPTIAPPPPDAGFDTYTGEGVGTCNGLPATIKFIFTDAGEPGIFDTAVYHISGACNLDISQQAVVDKGNHQAHKN